MSLTATWLHVVVFSGVNSAGDALTPAQHVLLARYCPSLATVLATYMGRHCPQFLAPFLVQLLQLAKLSFSVEDMTEQQMQRLKANDKKHAGRRLGTMSMDDLPAGSEPINWTSDEAFLRTGTWSGAHAAAGHPWAPSELGGNTVARPMQKWLADSKSVGTANDCVKHKQSSASMSSGLQLGWCTCGDCNGRCVIMHMMAQHSLRALLQS